MAHLDKVPIQEEHQVVGKLLFGELGEGPEIAEQDCELSLGAVEIARTAEPVPGLGRWPAAAASRGAGGADRRAARRAPRPRAATPLTSSGAGGGIASFAPSTLMRQVCRTRRHED
jgi:hypothetical protein